MPHPTHAFTAGHLDAALKATGAPLDGSAGPERAVAVFLAESGAGRSALAADAFLAHCAPGVLAQEVAALSESIARHRRPAAPIQELSARRFLWEALLHLSASLAGSGPWSLGFSDSEAGTSHAAILDLLKRREASESRFIPGVPLGRKVVERVLAAMASDGGRAGIPALHAGEIGPEIGDGGPRAFAEALTARIRGSAHLRILDARLGRFASVGPRDLLRLRHLGVSHASVDAATAARAFDEDPDLVERFRQEASHHLEWREEPDAHGDAMALTGGLLALWPDLCAFRLPSLRTGFQDFLVSFALNPNLSDDANESLQEAARIYGIATEFLGPLDLRLFPSAEAGRHAGPNIAFSFPAASEAARTITLRLSAQGIPSHATDVRSVAQAVAIVLDAFAGKAEAVLDGMPIARSYVTIRESLSVLRRAYRIFFAPEHRAAWLRWLEEWHELSIADAARVLDSVDLLGSAMGSPGDALRALAHPNFLLEETPEEACELERFCRRPDVSIEDARGALLRAESAGAPRDPLDRGDSPRALELTPELARVLSEQVGLPEGQAFGKRGLEPADWGSFEPVARSVAAARAAHRALTERLQSVSRREAPPR